MEQCSIVLMVDAGYAPGEGGQEDYSCDLLPQLGRQNILWVDNRLTIRQQWLSWSKNYKMPPLWGAAEPLLYLVDDRVINRIDTEWKPQLVQGAPCTRCAVVQVSTLSRAYVVDMAVEIPERDQVPLHPPQMGMSLSCCCCWQWLRNLLQSSSVLKVQQLMMIGRLTVWSRWGSDRTATLKH